MSLSVGHLETSGSPVPSGLDWQSMWKWVCKGTKEIMVVSSKGEPGVLAVDVVPAPKTPEDLKSIAVKGFGAGVVGKELINISQDVRVMLGFDGEWFFKQEEGADPSNGIYVEGEGQGSDVISTADRSVSSRGLEVVPRTKSRVVPTWYLQPYVATASALAQTYVYTFTTRGEALNVGIDTLNKAMSHFGIYYNYVGQYMAPRVIQTLKESFDEDLKTISSTASWDDPRYFSHYQAVVDPVGLRFILGVMVSPVNPTYLYFFSYMETLVEGADDVNMPVLRCKIKNTETQEITGLKRG